METLERVVRFEPGYDLRDPDPRQDRGIHGMQIRWVLKGPRGAVQFLLFTHWLPNGTAQEYRHAFPGGPPEKWQAMPADIGYHAYTPQYDGQGVIRPACDELGGAPCYYDGSGSGAEPIYWDFVTRGEDAIWEALAARYADIRGPQDAGCQDPGALQG